MLVVWHLAGLMVWFGAAAAAADHPSRWLLKARIQQGVELDDNMYETRSASESDGLYKIIVDTNAGYADASWTVQVHYHSGYQHYFNTPSENKWTNDLRVSCAIAGWKNRLMLGCQMRARVKFFHSHDWEYGLYDAEPYVSLALFGLRARFSVNFERLNYFQYNQFDYAAHALNFAVIKRFKSGVQVQIDAGQQSREYERFALVFMPYLNAPLYSTVPQSDVNHYGGCELSYQKRALFSLRYAFQDNGSNSYGFSYHQHRFILSTALPLNNTMLLRIFGGLQQKKYKESLHRIIVTELDTERENSNFIIVDLSKSITPSLSLLIRGVWYNNESPIPGRYYQKSLTSICLEYQF